MYRKLWLVNGNGEQFTFTEQNSKAFLNNISGMGFSKTINTTSYGNALKVNSSSYSFMQIGGEILFYDKVNKAYEDYFNFIKFISLEPLKLFYLPPNTLTPYFCDVELLTANKGEYNTNGTLSVPVSLQTKTHWLTSEKTEIVLTNGIVGVGKHYDLTRDYYYVGTNLSGYEITNNGSDEIGIEVLIEGDVTNPIWSLSQNGETYGTCKITGSYDVVRVNSVDSEEEIYLELDGSTIANPSRYQDLSISGGVLTFIKLKTGTSTFAFSCGNIESFTGTVTIKFNQSYISV